MATLEELTVIATQEIEEAKPMYKQVNNLSLIHISEPTRPY